MRPLVLGTETVISNSTANIAANVTDLLNAGAGAGARTHRGLVPELPGSCSGAVGLAASGAGRGRGARGRGCGAQGAGAPAATLVGGKGMKTGGMGGRSHTMWEPARAERGCRWRRGLSTRGSVGGAGHARLQCLHSLQGPEDESGGSRVRLSYPHLLVGPTSRLPCSRLCHVHTLASQWQFNIRLSLPPNQLEPAHIPVNLLPQ
eukprot:325741-Chlamydomonas_euryale.AAC.3